MPDTSQTISDITTEGKYSLNDTVHDENNKVRTEVVEGSAALDAAKRSDPPNPWSPRMLRLYGCLTVAYLCSTINGQKLGFNIHSPLT